MATRDCIEAPNLGLRNYPDRLHCGLQPTFFHTFSVRESDPENGAELLGRFSDARDFLQCALTSLTARDEGCFYSPEVTCLQHGLELLRKAHNDLDLWLIRESPPPRA
ncbi:hypothetical protein [Povalibacter sp.]|uniref:hypothetical protein n=1 Tax=Povalibacter sp. TaxID=1962978 RepID=UPI002F3ED40E